MRLLPYPCTIDEEAREAAERLRYSHPDEAELIERMAQAIRGLRTALRSADDEASTAYFALDDLRRHVRDATRELDAIP